MYQTFFGLRQTPFDLAADRSFLVETASQRAALDAIANLVRRRVGVITLEGWVGSGKSELLRAYERNADTDRVRVLQIARRDFDRGTLLEALGEGLVGPFAPPPRLEEMADLLAGRASAGQATVIVLDDAQKLTNEALRALGSLAELGDADDAPLSIVLAVSPPFVDLFSRPAAAALDKRASARVRLPPFTPAEARTLLEERLRRAGAEKPEAVLTPEAIETIVIAAGGIPRKLLALGDRVLRAGFAERRMPVDYATAETAIRGDAKPPAPTPVRVRTPISVEDGEPDRFMPAAGRRISRAVVPVCLLAAAVGLGYWLWNISNETPVRPLVETTTGTPNAAPSVPPPTTPQPTATQPAPARPTTPSPTAPPPTTLTPTAPAVPPQTATVPPLTPPAAPPNASADVLFIPARRGDTLRSIYRTVYRSSRDRPSFEALLAANPGLSSDKRLEAGELVALPGPPSRN
ncbi:hypothetical protein GCM10011611_14180 [Aliidongia dinghuensis]|uniref:AAA+ ATPase domain-containing protein n=1 Tax=Aliidongia dinghuensis TaxID=1867774 RepID=A0A8J2YQU3_9PROT|nr:AAA family ATPase [Aliidongia dinghuensis]GGF09821.1 hypothetical protein GCM10011611_14180 [Aliidongia dinghuensis]